MSTGAGLPGPELVDAAAARCGRTSRNQAAPQVAAAVSLLTLLFGIALLVGLSYLTARRRKVS